MDPNFLTEEETRLLHEAVGRGDDVGIGKVLDAIAEKRKEWNPNPWAVCSSTVGREDKEKYERCVMAVKKRQKK